MGRRSRTRWCARRARGAGLPDGRRRRHAAAPPEWRQAFTAGVQWRVYLADGACRAVHSQPLAAPAPQAVRDRWPGRCSAAASTCWTIGSTQPRSPGAPRLTLACASTARWWRRHTMTMARAWCAWSWRAMRPATSCRPGASCSSRCGARCGMDLAATAGARQPAGDGGAPRSARAPVVARQPAQPAQDRGGLPAGDRRRALEVIIANAYFLPGLRLRRALVRRAPGVRVACCCRGRYEYFLQYHASRPVYGALLAGRRRDP